MEGFEIYFKWREKLDLYLEGQKNFVPETSAKEFIKNNLNAILFDCLIYSSANKNFNKKFKDLCEELINMAIGKRKELDEGHKGCVLGFAKKLPGLDYYDNRRDKFSSNELVPHQGQFGVWNNDE